MSATVRCFNTYPKYPDILDFIRKISGNYPENIREISGKYPVFMYGLWIIFGFFAEY